MQSVNASLSSGITVEVIVGSVIMAILNLVAIVSNILVLTAICRAPHLRNSLTNVFVINLCCVDLLGAMVVVPLSTVSFALSSWPFGDTMCLAHAFLNSLFSFASILSLSVISFERFYSIKSPMHYAVHMTPCRAYSLVVFIEIQSIVFSSLAFLRWEDNGGVGKTMYCTNTWISDDSLDVYIIIIFVFCYALPGISLLLMYIGVFRVALTARNKIRPFPLASCQSRRVPEVTVKCPSSAEGVTLSDTISVKQETFRRRSTSQLKAVKTLLLLTGMYLILWGPYYGLSIFGAINNIPHMPILEHSFIWLGFSSFAVNPFLYGWMNRSIRDELIKLVLSVRCKFSYDSTTDIEDENIGSQEDFLQFLERTTCSTRLTTQQTLSLKSSLDKGCVESIPGHVELHV